MPASQIYTLERSEGLREIVQQFIDFEVTRHNIIYSAPLFWMGGIIYLYRESISAFVKKYQYVVFGLA